MTTDEERGLRAVVATAETLLDHAQPEPDWTGDYRIRKRDHDALWNASVALRNAVDPSPYGPVVVERARVERLLKGIDVLLRRIANDDGQAMTDNLANILFDPSDRDPLP